ncbi:PA0069 family radical SAM protein [Aquimarina intermedia]|uniref:DNA repair photolyase n=1 Tax=Aquimarina intermedia TaxID=350814 RepID=A0A5S5C9V7_9FLAO|nr:PA0069 family radical SAM protein [Aquimarina intermedia]TYP76191.1 DNA repair photolyase [Aquimarina intermedia]
MKAHERLKGRGAQAPIDNHFESLSHELRSDFLNYCFANDESAISNKTSCIDTFPKTIINKVNSPDLGLTFSLNPYQGCEHGCVYCYARNSHEYWGYNAGLDFESKILIKKNAPELLEAKLKSTSWKAAPIVLSGNTDCYQPIEKEYQITRKLLEIFWKYRHPVSIITKNSLILRDLDLLNALHQYQLISVHLSITTLEEDTKNILEPRTASIKKRLQTLSTLTDNNIPTHIMMAPIIPSINSHEILPLCKKVSELGADTINYTIVRLNGAIGQIFTTWLEKTLPDRKDKILNQIKECHNGALNDSVYGRRMKGDGQVADQIAQLFTIARTRYFKNKKKSALNTSMHQSFKNGQLTLF